MIADADIERVERIARAVIGRVNVGIVVVDSAHRILLWNRFFESYTGLLAAATIGCDLFEVFPELPRKWLEKKIRSVFLLRSFAFTSWRQRPFLFRFRPHRPVTGTQEYMQQDCTFFPIERGDGAVEAVGISVTDVTEVSMYQRLLERANVSLEQDLQLSGAVQSLLLPDQAQYSSERFALAGYYEAAAHCSGDWWWYRVRTDGSVVVFVGDVAGHGAPSAMITVAVGSTLQTLEELRPDDTVEAILAALNRRLRTLGHGQYWMTMTVVELSSDGASMRLLSAGSPPALMMAPDGEVTSLGGVGQMLGEAELRLAIEEHDLCAGHRFFLFTDGAYEFDTPRARRPFGLRRLRDLLRETVGMDLDRARRHVSERLAAVRGLEPQADDVTFVLLDVR